MLQQSYDKLPTKKQIQSIQLSNSVIKPQKSLIQSQLQFQKNYPKNIFIPMIQYLAEINLKTQYQQSIGSRQQFEGKNVVSLSLIHKLMGSTWFIENVTQEVLISNISNKILMNSKIKKKLFHLFIVKNLFKVYDQDLKQFKKKISKLANAISTQYQYEYDQMFQCPSEILYLLRLFYRLVKNNNIGNYIPNNDSKNGNYNQNDIQNNQNYNQKKQIFINKSQENNKMEEENNSINQINLNDCNHTHSNIKDSQQINKYYNQNQDQIKKLINDDMNEDIPNQTSPSKIQNAQMRNESNNTSEYEQGQYNINKENMNNNMNNNINSHITNQINISNNINHIDIYELSDDLSKLPPRTGSKQQYKYYIRHIINHFNLQLLKNNTNLYPPITPSNSYKNVHLVVNSSFLSKLSLVTSSIQIREQQIMRKYELPLNVPGWNVFIRKVVEKCFQSYDKSAKITHAMINQWIQEFKEIVTTVKGYDELDRINNNGRQKDQNQNRQKDDKNSMNNNKFNNHDNDQNYHNNNTNYLIDFTKNKHNNFNLNNSYHRQLIDKKQLPYYFSPLILQYNNETINQK